MASPLLQRFLRQDKGSMLLEAVIAMGLISTLMLGYAGASTNSTVIQRTAVNESIAAQTAQGVLETARAVPWSDVSTSTAPDGSLLEDGEVALTGGTLDAGQVKQVRGLNVTVDTAVTWEQEPAGASSYGVKSVTVKATWRDNVANPETEHSIVQEIIITPGVGEAVPSGVRGS